MQLKLFWFSCIAWRRLSTCVLRRADAVAVALLVHGAGGPGRRKPPVGGQCVGGASGVRPVQRPLAGVAAPRRRRPGFGSASGSGICGGKSVGGQEVRRSRGHEATALLNLDIVI